MAIKPIQRLKELCGRRPLDPATVERAYSTEEWAYCVPEFSGRSPEEIEVIVLKELRNRGIRICTKRSKSRGLWGGTSTAFRKSLYLSHWHHQRCTADRAETLCHEWFHYQRREVIGPVKWDLRYISDPEFAWLEEALAYRESVRRAYAFGEPQKRLEHLAASYARSLAGYLVIGRRCDVETRTKEVLLWCVNELMEGNRG